MTDRRQHNQPVERERRAMEPERERWKFNKEISLADLLSFVSAALAVVYAYTTLDKRLTVVEEKMAQQAGTDGRQDADALRYQARIDSQLADISRKLDRLIERK